MLSARDFLLRGLLAGLIAGLAAFAVAYVVGEPSVNAAIGLEEAGGGHSHAEGTGDHDHGEAAPAGTETEVPRSLQSTVGLLTGTAVAGTTLGGLLGVLAALALGRFGGVGPRATTLGLVAAAFVAAYVVPFVAYPPNPPAVGSGDTIGYRTALYFLLVAISIIGGVVAVLTGRRLAVRLGGWHAGLLAGAGYLVVMVAVVALMPHYNEVGADFPATVLYEFRQASLLTQLTLWGVLGLVLAELVGRVAGRATAADRELADVRG